MGQRMLFLMRLTLLPLLLSLFLQSSVAVLAKELGQLHDINAASAAADHLIAVLEESTPGAHANARRRWVPPALTLDQLNGTYGLNRRGNGNCVPGGSDPCVQGCCSKQGGCGFGPDFCSAATCDSQCNATPPATQCGKDAPPGQFSCGAGKGCCSKYGNCGFTTDHCGDGCQDACDSKPQPTDCGKDAGGKTCGLNTCCSQFGYCGSSADFCGTGCQSNCVLHPAPPAGRSNVGILQNRVIGYYESWAARSTAYPVKVTDIPLNDLTHLNYAFGGIDPNTWDVTTMDSKTPASSFSDVMEAKRYNPNLKIFLSIGGWTFSDPGPSQAIFGNIARSEANSRAFATNVVNFLRRYGFDGLDIDWEYPAAPDRGGTFDDTPNYTNMMRIIRETFDASGNQYGLSVAIPSSFWYLRWFDLPGLSRYVNWFNMMTYDIHGSWDVTNNDPEAGGPYARPHTDLTEIKAGVELLWRVGIQPAMVNLGFGFYGRTYKLADPSCNTPWCRFSGDSDRGWGSDQPGVLMYYEIQALLKQNPGIQPYWNKTAAVKYFKYSGDQWISYDDADTFAQKVDWANSIGLGGAMIWASDTDDDKFSAHSGLLGRQVYHVNVATTKLATTKSAGLKQSSPQVMAETYDSLSGSDCKVITGSSAACFNPDSPGPNPNLVCPAGWLLVGSRKFSSSDTSDKSCPNPAHERPICCAKGSVPKHCTWRDGLQQGRAPGAVNRVTPTCNGQCDLNERQIMTSKFGGRLNAAISGNNQCVSGTKSFCCETVDQIGKDNFCFYSTCDNPSCPGDSKQMFRAFKACDANSAAVTTINFCCPASTNLYECKWRGTGPDCNNAVCAPDETQVDEDIFGDGTAAACTQGKTKKACCKVRAVDAPQDTCIPDYCAIYPEDCFYGDDDVLSSDSETDINLRKRFLSNSSEHLNRLERRIGRTGALALQRAPGARQLVWLVKAGIDGLTTDTRMAEVKYFQNPSAGAFYNTAFRRENMFKQKAVRLPYPVCGTRVKWMPVTDLDNPNADGKLETEHPLDLQLLQGWINAATPGGQTQWGTDFPYKMSMTWLKWFTGEKTLLSPMPGITSMVLQHTMPLKHLMHCFGSFRNPLRFRLCDDDINQRKGVMFKFQTVLDTDEIAALADVIKTGDRNAVEKAKGLVQLTIDMLQYGSSDIFNDALVGVAQDCVKILSRLAGYHPEGGNAAVSFALYIAMAIKEASGRQNSAVTLALNQLSLAIFQGFLAQDEDQWRIYNKWIVMSQNVVKNLHWGDLSDNRPLGPFQGLIGFGDYGTVDQGRSRRSLDLYSSRNPASIVELFTFFKLG